MGEGIFSPSAWDKFCWSSALFVLRLCLLIPSLLSFCILHLIVRRRSYAGVTPAFQNALCSSCSHAFFTTGYGGCFHGKRCNNTPQLKYKKLWCQTIQVRLYHHCSYEATRQILEKAGRASQCLRSAAQLCSVSAEATPAINTVPCSTAQTPASRTSTCKPAQAPRRPVALRLCPAPATSAGNQADAVAAAG